MSERQIIEAYRPLRRHPDLFSGRSGWTAWIHAPLLAALADLRGGNESAVRSLLREEVPGVYSFQFLSEEFCDMFLEELDSYYASGLPVARPNSMNNCTLRESNSHSSNPHPRAPLTRGSED